MNQFDSSSEQRHSECKTLLDACTPLVYRHNAFRITGLPVDASAREIKRRIDDLKHAEQMGDAAQEHGHAFALDPPPSLDRIREAAQSLQDPERRIIEEFFWFWPTEWGKGKQDRALAALATGDKDTPFKTWSQALLHDHPAAASTIAKHNLAVLYHLVALDAEHVALQRDLSADYIARVEKYWRTCFKWWEELTADETFWSMVADRIRMLDDPRLTTGVARRMRRALPEALGTINAMLAIQFAEKGNLEFARKHIAFMKESHQDQDNLLKTLAAVTKPLKTRVHTAVETATKGVELEPANGADCAQELLQIVEQPIQIIRIILPEQDRDRIDLCDSVADACLACQIAFARQTREWSRSLVILDCAAEMAESEEMQDRVEENRNLVESAFLMDAIFKECERASELAEKDPSSSDKEAQRLLSVAPALLAKLEEVGGPAGLHDRAKDEVAGTVMRCAVAFGNKTEKWQPCIALLEASLRFVASSELEEQILNNLQTVRHNNRLFGNLRPLSSTPSLSTTNGIGFALYGATDKDPETGSHLATYYFVVLGIPVFPIRRYRVIPISGGYRFLGKTSLRAFDKWHLFISLVLIASFILYIVAVSDSGGSSRNSRPSSSSSSPSQGVTSPRRSSYETQSFRSTLAAEIENGKQRAKQMESQIEEMDRRLAGYKLRMSSYRTADMVDEYNSLVPTFNSLVNQRNQLYGEYSALIDDVNAKVGRYNAGNR